MSEPSPDDLADPGDVTYFDYDLPADRIAQDPVEPRHAARLLVDRLDGRRHRTVADLGLELAPGDVLVVNDTRVSAARLPLTKATGGKVEVLLLEPTGVGRQWQALVRGGRRVAPGTRLHHDGEPVVEVGDDLGDGRRLVEVLQDDLMDRVGQIPLPPYIHRPLADRERYQTVFARQPGSVAAPTAGLHLSTELLGQIEASRIEVVTVELRVGLGTFRPITADRVDAHHMHAEQYHLTPESWERIRAARRVVAVGTTVVRTLESAARTGELGGATELFISRGFDWQVVDVLLTNFHVPRSSLLVLVDAFVGPRWRDIYDEALREGYRFLSLGDAMLLDRRHPGQW
ncbi:MAG: tRNA preQ1(34) S-adenosylmethionine ribosyltransferase-isomerase QueA [Actinomycetota bacterium]